MHAYIFLDTRFKVIGFALYAFLSVILYAS